MDLSFNYKTLILDEFEKRKKRNNRYSLRAFAKFLDVSVTALSQMLNSKRELSPKNIRKVAEKLLFDESLKKQIINNVSRKKHAKEIEYFKIEEDIFITISDWYYYAILNLACLKDNTATPEWISQRLGIDQYVAESALNRLMRLQLIEIKGYKLVRTTKPLDVGKNIPSKVIRDYHRNNLKKAEASIETVAVENRQFQSIVVPVDMDKYKLAQAKIDTFIEDMTSFLMTEQCSEVYTLAIQLFPNTIIENRS